MFGMTRMPEEGSCMSHSAVYTKAAAYQMQEEKQELANRVRDTERNARKKKNLLIYPATARVADLEDELYDSQIYKKRLRHVLLLTKEFVRKATSNQLQLNECERNFLTFSGLTFIKAI